MNDLQLTPTYWASVSGGKDSLLMLQIILKNLDKYPLNGVVHFELELKYYPECYLETIEQMRATEKIRETELGRPFSVRSSDPKYNAEYVDNIVRTKWLKKLEEKEREFNELYKLF